MSPTAPKTVLFVDDEPDFTELITMWLEKDTMEVRIAHNGKDALELLRQKPADVIITDMRMPGMNGMELIETVQNKHPDTATILMTADAFTPSPSTEHLPYPVGHLSKPFNLKSIHAAISTTLKEREQQAS